MGKQWKALDWDGGVAKDTTWKNGPNKRIFYAHLEMAPTLDTAARFDMYVDPEKTPVDTEDGNACKYWWNFDSTAGGDRYEIMVAIPIQPGYYYRWDSTRVNTSLPQEFVYEWMDFDVVEGHDHKGVVSRLIPDVHPEDELRKRFVVVEDRASIEAHGLREAGVVEDGYGNKSLMDRRAGKLLDEGKDPEDVFEFTGTVGKELAKEPKVGDKVEIQELDETFQVRTVDDLGDGRYHLTLGTSDGRLKKVMRRDKDQVKKMARYK